MSREGFAGQKIRALLSATWLAQACYAAVRLNIPDLLVGAPRTADELAERSGAHPQALDRLLRVLASAGVFRQTGPGTFALNPVSDLLRTDAPGGARLAALMHGEEVFRSFAEIMHTVYTGQPAFEAVYGMPFYAYLESNPEAARTFAVAMGAQPVPATLSTCDMVGVRTVVDVGGGNGSLLAELLVAHPDARGVLVELPAAARQAREALTEAGLADRVELVEGNFFDGVPAGGDLYVLARVLHNWTDERAATLLRRVRAAMAAGSRLVVFEELLPEDNEASPLTRGMVDLLMLVTLEGRDRTEVEYRKLLSETGFEVVAVHPGIGPGAAGAIEAVAT